MSEPKPTYQTVETAVSLTAEEIAFLLQVLPQLPLSGKAADLVPTLAMLEAIMKKLRGGDG